MSEKTQGPRRIGGWLVLPAIWLALSPAFQVLVIRETLFSLPHLDRGARLFLTAWILVHIGLVWCLLRAAYSFFRRKRDAPEAVVAYLWTLLGVEAGFALGSCALLRTAVGAENLSPSG